MPQEVSYLIKEEPVNALVIRYIYKCMSNQTSEVTVNQQYQLTRILFLFLSPIAQINTKSVNGIRIRFIFI